MTEYRLAHLEVAQTFQPHFVHTSGKSTSQAAQPVANPHKYHLERQADIRRTFNARSTEIQVLRLTNRRYFSIHPRLKCVGCEIGACDWP